ncbi:MULTISPECIES: DNA alkylation repair protein [unclassified Roseitalea]|uniref:DNA alkylation repair protein n=1 Tax=unclassified Roseitalea TaxID=2639107 RepID=UPI00273F47B4|nr:MULTISPECIES: DNA alkylation repair protein [unclassified Roseitalea]
MTVDAILAWLAGNGTPEGLASMARYNIPGDNAFGIAMGDLKRKAKAIGRDHDLALALWDIGKYEARVLAAEIADPARLSEAVMDRWCADFDSWAICDHTCFVLFDRTPFAWAKVHEWAPREAEFVRRAAYALVWALSVHDKAAGDAAFEKALALIEAAPEDARPLVKKAVDMALRAVGKRNANLNASARRTCAVLMDADTPARRWIGRHALRELESAKVQERVNR